jgi:hypothetical protein
MARGDNFRDPEFQKKMRERHEEKYGSKREGEKSEHYQAWGRKGWDKTLTEHGPDVAYEGARQYRLKHPSKPEQAMMKILDQMKIEYEREMRVFSLEGRATLYSMDFYLKRTHQAIEVDSGVHDIDPKRSARQWAEKQRLLEGVQIPVLVVHTRDIKSGLAASMVDKFIQEGLDTLDKRWAKYKGMKRADDENANTEEPVQRKKPPGFGYGL